ncbi:hypothetical protein [Reyranella sp.]|jgi:hypothetical protein|uniref:hypothetical protein n=1 Tax=Reyranella sp. TaxID=1929291 RepID=UPI000BD5FBAC|nr:hypothetical protein [Reyranella sp.]OYY34451.1 MAG: hypothetical protein B7Y57_28095 [Rhodospirillales bacterium 35-66-84]OYZ91019.1 MAG: hypothetical protein B7Y08_28000 [Rhodospirillales bacterium 24-66-33]OZB21515.1 MAG: hypothetical protein B7X63_27095 [Rhodospirillales bacterium 39-66-50]HQS18592.1 hypothetical protein [Reyranella sp.]HQT15413.1 hypothetical protein [Reyranella sp.]
MSWFGLLAALLPKALDLLVGLFVKKQPPPDLSRELGRAEQQNADMRADTAIQRRANDAAKKVEQEEGTDDPNDRDYRR